MIIVCAGDSFTAGAELWEEKYIPGYTEITDAITAFAVINKMQDHKTEAMVQYNLEYQELISGEIINLISMDSEKRVILSDRIKQLRDKFLIDEINKIESNRTDLSYSAILGKKLNCKTINTGKNGSSEIDTMQRTIKLLKKIKKTTSAKILCILQNTYDQRVWLKTNPDFEMESVILQNIERKNSNKLQAMQLKEIYMKYFSDELFQIDYINSSLSLQKYCVENSIKFIHFNLHSHNDFIKSEMGTVFCNPTYYVGDMRSMLKNHFKSNDFSLPGGHVNCESHEIIADWLIEEMKKRNIL